MAVERIQYRAGAVMADGALVWNDRISGRRPLLLVMPNWLGVTETAIRRAEKVAGDKYIASSPTCTAEAEERAAARPSRRN